MVTSNILISKDGEEFKPFEFEVTGLLEKVKNSVEEIKKGYNYPDTLLTGDSINTENKD